MCVSGCVSLGVPCVFCLCLVRAPTTPLCCPVSALYSVFLCVCVSCAPFRVPCVFAMCTSFFTVRAPPHPGAWRCVPNTCSALPPVSLARVSALLRPCVVTGGQGDAGGDKSAGGSAAGEPGSAEAGGGGGGGARWLHVFAPTAAVPLRPCSHALSRNLIARPSHTHAPPHPNLCHSLCATPFPTYQLLAAARAHWLLRVLSAPCTWSPPMPRTAVHTPYMPPPPRRALWSNVPSVSALIRPVYCTANKSFLFVWDVRRGDQGGRCDAPHAPGHASAVAGTSGTAPAAVLLLCCCCAAAVLLLCYCSAAAAVLLLCCYAMFIAQHARNVLVVDFLVPGLCAASTREVHTL
jgi:hypothetical protein